MTQGDRPLNAHGKTDAELVAIGGELWEDAALSGGGNTSCSTCHAGYAAMMATFSEPFPHHVAMAELRAGLPQVTAAEMVQLCMVIPMQAQPLAWDSEELAALSAYVVELQKGFPPGRRGESVCGQPVRGQPVWRLRD